MNVKFAPDADANASAEVCAYVVDVLLSGGLIVDGNGGQPYVGDVLIGGSRILAVGDAGPVDALTTRIDAQGLVVSPGFIDMHSHSDIQIRASDHAARLLQGITTEVLGQDGLSVAPIDDDTRAHLRVQLAGWNGSEEIPWEWRGVDEYLAWLREGIPVNAAYLVPHANLRLLIMGNRPGKATPDELHAMSALLAEALRQGAVGLSAGLTYVPGSYADTAELIALCRVVAEAGGYFCPHHRNYWAEVMAGFAECIEIARASKVRLHLAHAHLSFPSNAGRIEELIEMFDGALTSGVDLTFDSYPYLAGMTSLHALLPSWTLAGTQEQQLALLNDPAQRARIAIELDVEGTDGNQGLPVDWTTVRISSAPDLPRHWVGRSVVEIAEETGLPPSAQFLDIVVDTRFSATCTLHFGIEDHVRILMRHDRHTVGTDGILVGTAPHPRGWGSYARVLGHYVPAGVLTLPAAIRHMTASPARILRLSDRGVLAAGTVADIVVFDAGAIRDVASYDDPRRSPTGVEYVFVNGVIAVARGRVLGTRSGQVLTSVRTPATGNGA